MRLEIKGTKIMNQETKIAMIKEIFIIYLKCLFYYPMNKDLRKKLIRLMKGFFISLKNEEEILNVLDVALISQEDFDFYLVYLDGLFDESYQYYDSIIGDFEVAIDMNNLDRVMYQNEIVKPISEEKKQDILSRIQKSSR